MKIIFAGTPDFAAAALKSLIEAGHEIALVLSQPDRPSGRGMKLTASPVKLLAQQHGIEVLTPLTLSLKRRQRKALPFMNAFVQRAPICLLSLLTGLFFRNPCSTVQRASESMVTFVP